MQYTYEFLLLLYYKFNIRKYVAKNNYVTIIVTFMDNLSRHI